MSFDLIAYARARRYRVRNLHDGRPLHPLRLPRRGRGRVTGFQFADDRMDAIIGRHGYVCDDGEPGRIGWYVFAGSRKGMNRWLPKFTAAGAAIKQECDTEAAGDAPVESLDAILRVIEPFTERPAELVPRRSGRQFGQKSHATAGDRGSGRGKSKQPPLRDSTRCDS